ncbi:hypothetical protein DFH06DRAFT_1227901, partial [Mycena polygramma]
MRNRIRHRDEANETHALQARFIEASKQDLNYNIFEKDTHAATFVWQFAATFAKKDVRIVGWPADVRLPPQMPAKKGIASLNSKERKSLTAALDARESAGKGLRLEHSTHSPGDYVVYTHDYGVSAIDPRSWRRSTAPMLCMNEKNEVWQTAYDLDGPPAAPASRQRVPTEKGDVVEDEPVKTTGKRSAAGKVKSSAKGKGRADDTEDNIAERKSGRARSLDNEPSKDSKPTKRSRPVAPAPPLRPATRSHTRTQPEPAQEGGGRKPVPPGAIRRRAGQPGAIRRRAGQRVHFTPESEDDDDAPLAPRPRPAAPKRSLPDSSEEEDTEQPPKRAKSAADASAAPPSQRRQQLSHVELTTESRPLTRARSGTKPASIDPPATSKDAAQRKRVQEQANAVVNPVVPGPILYSVHDAQPIGRVYSDPEEPRFVTWRPLEQRPDPAATSSSRPPPVPSWTQGPPPDAASSSRSQLPPVHASPPPSPLPENIVNALSSFAALLQGPNGG